MNNNKEVKTIIKSLRGGGVIFYKQFNKIVNSNNTINYKNQNFIKFKINNILAFSLIELSIVLIIIGLLVAGVTGGASLIESAKIRALSNEINNYKQAYFTFRVAKDRAPGDLNNSGMIGLYSGQTYNTNSFPDPYNSNTKNGIPNEISAPFVDLYLAQIIDFQPTEVNTSTYSKPNDKAKPTSSILKNCQYYFEYGQGNNANTHYKYKIKPGNKITIYGLKTIDPKYLQNYDIKYDDSLYNNGSVRSNCEVDKNNNYMDYETSILEKQKCSLMIVGID